MRHHYHWKGEGVQAITDMRHHYHWKGEGVHHQGKELLPTHTDMTMPERVRMCNHKVQLADMPYN